MQQVETANSKRFVVKKIAKQTILLCLLCLELTFVNSCNWEISLPNSDSVPPSSFLEQKLFSRLDSDTLALLKSKSFGVFLLSVPFSLESSLFSASFLLICEHQQHRFKRSPCHVPLRSFLNNWVVCQSLRAQKLQCDLSPLT